MLEVKIRILCQKFVIICATRAGAILRVLACKISVLRQKLDIFMPLVREKCSVLACKISILRQKIVIICVTRAGDNFSVLACKISVLRQKLVVICANSAGAI